MAYPVLPLSIRGLFNKSSMNQLILPALQRDYVWKAKDICKLFDSLLHPKKGFEPFALSIVTFSTPNDSALANDKVTFDTIPNLELLDASTNRSKNKQSLDNWLAGVSAADQAKLPKDHFFAGLPTGLQDFGTFIGDRKQQLEQVLTKML